MNVFIKFRDGSTFHTAVTETPDYLSVGKRMSGGGFMIFTDSRWETTRTLVVNLADVSVVEFWDTENQ